MNALTYDKRDVIKRLKKNRDDHGAKVSTAQDKYQDLITAELEKRLGQAREGKSVDPAFLSRFPIPEDYTREYDSIIDQLEASKEDIIELTAQEFNMWMRDEWQWMRQFTASSSRYLS